MRQTLTPSVLALFLCLCVVQQAAAQRMTQSNKSYLGGSIFAPQGRPLAREADPPARTAPSRTNPRMPERMPERMPSQPTQPRNNLGEDIARLAIGLGIGALDAELKRNASQPQNQVRIPRDQPSRDYRPEQNYNTYRPSTRPQPSNNYPSNNYPSNNYVQPVPYNPVVTVPANNYVQPEVSIPKNTLPIQKTIAPGNRAFNQIPKSGFSLTGAQADEAVADLNEQIGRDAKEFDESHNAADKTLDGLRNQVNDPNSPLTQQQKDAINQALDSKDPQQVRKALEDAGAPPEFADLMAKSQQESNAKADLLAAINNGASSQEISQLAEAYTAAQVDAINAAGNIAGNTIDPNKAQQFVNQTSQDLNDLIAKQSAIESIQELQSQAGNLASTGGFIGLPTGDVIATWLPQLPAGDFVAVDSQTVFVGTGGSGEVFSGAVTPAEAGFPVVLGAPTESISDEAPLTGEIVLHNPAENQASISYVLDRHVFTMEPKHTQRLPLRSWTIKFDRGGNFGSVEKVIQSGVYHFKTTAKGWDLVEIPSKVVIDNASNPYDFNFVINDRVMIAKARSVLELSDPLPMDFRFDQGNGTTVRKSLGQGTYSVGVNPQTKLLDLVVAKKLDAATTTDVSDPRESMLTSLKEKPLNQIEATKTNPLSLEKPTVLTPPKRLSKVQVAKPALPQTSSDRPVPLLPPR